MASPQKNLAILTPSGESFSGWPTLLNFSADARVNTTPAVRKRCFRKNAHQRVERGGGGGDKIEPLPLATHYPLGVTLATHYSLGVPLATTTHLVSP